MRKRTYHFARQIRQFKNLIKKIQSTNTKAIPYLEKQKLFNKLKKSCYHLLNIDVAKRVITSTAIVLGLVLTSNAQNIFKDPVKNPFGINHLLPYDEQNISLIDIDSDGDLDLVSLSYNEYYSYSSYIKYITNKGDVNNINFKEQADTIYRIENDSIPLMISDRGRHFSIVDIDLDGDFNLFTFTESYDGCMYCGPVPNLYHYGEIETGNNLPQLQQNSIDDIPYITGISSLTKNSICENNVGWSNGPNDKYLIADYDLDGDMDVILPYYCEYDYDETKPIIYLENRGLEETILQSGDTVITLDMVRLSNNPFTKELENIYKNNWYMDFIDPIDFDYDGDHDLLALINTNSNKMALLFFENLGKTLGFSAPDTIKLPNFDISKWSQIAIGDLDGDLDNDLMVFSSEYLNHKDIYYFENTTNIPQNIFKPDYAIQAKLFPNPFASITTIQFENNANELFRLKVYDLQGKIVFNEQTLANEFKIDGTSLINGLYFYELTSNTNYASGKMVVK